MFHPMLTAFCFVFNHFFDREAPSSYQLSFDQDAEGSAE
jgi:hypothetical protein